MAKYKVKWTESWGHTSMDGHGNHHTITGKDKKKKTFDTIEEARLEASERSNCNYNFEGEKYGEGSSRSCNTAEILEKDGFSWNPIELFVDGKPNEYAFNKKYPPKKVKVSREDKKRYKEEAEERAAKRKEEELEKWRY
jgi:hypothetical protein